MTERPIAAAISAGILLAIVSTTRSAAVESRSPSLYDQDIVQLDCKFDHRNIAGIVLFKHLEMIRLVYGDGGIVDWHNVDFTKAMLIGHNYANGVDDPKADEHVNSLIIAKNYEDVVYIDDGEFSRGHCDIVEKQDKYMIDPKKDNAYWMNR